METRSIKVSAAAHRALKTMAAKSDKHVWQIVDTAVALLMVDRNGALKAKNGRLKGGVK